MRADPGGPVRNHRRARRWYVQGATEKGESSLLTMSTNAGRVRTGTPCGIRPRCTWTFAIPGPVGAGFRESCKCRARRELAQVSPTGRTGLLRTRRGKCSVAPRDRGHTGSRFLEGSVFECHLRETNRGAMRGWSAPRRVGRPRSYLVRIKNRERGGILLKVDSAARRSTRAGNSGRVLAPDGSSPIRLPK
jgi:hypothetical protein